MASADSRPIFFLYSASLRLRLTPQPPGVGRKCHFSGILCLYHNRFEMAETVAGQRILSFRRLFPLGYNIILYAISCEPVYDAIL